jgi:hypothetical protein
MEMTASNKHAEDNELWPKKLPRLQQHFRNLTLDWAVDVTSKNEIVETILRKASHAYYKSLLLTFQGDTVKRKGKSHTAATLCLDLRVQEAAKEKKKNK